MFLGGTSLVYLSIVITFITKNYKPLRAQKKRHLIYWKSNWNIGKWLLGSNLLFYISSNIYPWFLLYLSSKENIAIFAVLMSTAGLINPILIALSSYLLPIFVKANSSYSKVRLLTNKWQFVFGTMAIILIITGFLLGQKIILLLFSKAYNNLGLLVVYPFIYQAINVFFQPNKIALNAIKRTDVNFYVLIPRSCITLVFGYFLVLNFGLSGVFYTMLIENIVYQTIYFITYRKIIQSRNSVPPVK